MALGGRDRTWCAGEIGHNLGFDERIQVVSHADPGHKAQPLRLGRAENPARHENPPGHRCPQLGHHIGADGGWHEAELGLGQAKLGSLDTYGHVADANDPDPAAKGIALNAGNHRTGEGIEGGQHVSKASCLFHLLFSAGFGLVFHPAKVSPGAETGA